MRLSREKINHLSNLFLQEMENSDDVDILVEPNELRLQFVRIVTDILRVDDVIDEIVRETLSSYSRKIPESSSEWEVMYKKLYEEEMQKRFKF